VYDKWKSILDSTDYKKEWMSKYDDIHFNEFCDDQIESNSGCTITTNLFPIAMKIASKTFGLDLVSVKPMSGPTLGNSELNEEKYLNERRKKILDDIFDEEEIDFDNLDKIENTDFNKLDEIKNNFMEGDGLFYLDYKYPTSKNNEDLR